MHFLKRHSGLLIIRCFRYLKGEGIEFAEIFIDRTFPEENAPTRKPGTAMLTTYLSQGIDLESSYVIGDRITDLQLAENLGCNAIYIKDEPHPLASFNTSDWNDIYKYLKINTKKSTVYCEKQKRPQLNWK